METIELTCIVCPLGCQIKLEKDGDKIISVTGNTCKRGYDYSIQEVLSPKRVLTTTVKTLNGILLSVKSNMPLPKGKLTECMKIINGVTVNIPVKIGDVIIKNIENTGVDIVATKNIF